MPPRDRLNKPQQILQQVGPDQTVWKDSFQKSEKVRKQTSKKKYSAEDTDFSR